MDIFTFTVHDICSILIVSERLRDLKENIRRREGRIEESVDQSRYLNETPSDYSAQCKSNVAHFHPIDPLIYLGIRKYSGPRLIHPLDNWASHLIRPNSSTYFEAELSGAHMKWSP